MPISVKITLYNVKFSISSKTQFISFIFLQKEIIVQQIEISVVYVVINIYSNLTLFINISCLFNKIK